MSQGLVVIVLLAVCAVFGVQGIQMFKFIQNLVKDIKENHVYIVRYQTYGGCFLDEELFVGKSKDDVREKFSKKYPDREILRLSALNED